MRRCIDGALDALHGGEGSLLERVAALAREVEALAGIDPGYAEEAEALEGFRQRLLELDGRLRREEREAGGGFDAEAVEARLFELSRLRRKLGRSLEEIIDFRAEIAENLSFLDSCALDMKRLDRREAELARALGGCFRPWARRGARPGRRWPEPWRRSCAGWVSPRRWAWPSSSRPWRSTRG